MPRSDLHDPVLHWYAHNARQLPWRRPGTSAWQVLVSEVLLQQTPVRRVLPVYAEWIKRWPTPAALAAAPPSEAIRVWGRLGYPRRALRLHQAATSIVATHGGRVPRSTSALTALPGIGAYTAAAVAAFAFGERHPVLDTNVRRVLARAGGGQQWTPRQLTRAELLRAEMLLPDPPAVAARWSVAVMELGALVCTARAPLCSQCPLESRCRWRAAGWPAAGTPRRGQSYAGTDRQCRGRLLAALRDADGPLPRSQLEAVWSAPKQCERSLQSLVADGLAERLPGGRYQLPGSTVAGGR